MMYPDSMRASDEDRQRVVDALQDQTGQGRLTLTEFDQRSAQAYAATTLGELRALTRDLPVNVLPFGSTPNMPFVGMVPHAGWQGGRYGQPRDHSRELPAQQSRRLLTSAAVVLLVLFVASTAIGFVAHALFFPFPFIILGFLLLRASRGGHGGPGYHQR